MFFIHLNNNRLQAVRESMFGPLGNWHRCCYVRIFREGIAVEPSASMGVTETLQDHVGGCSTSLPEVPNYISANSPAMRLIERVATEIAPTDIPILLVGESGTGKEILAWRIHELSSRRAEAFVKVRGSEFSPLLAAKGHRHSGNGKSTRIASCKGTLFLDEICDLNGDAQTKLLAALPDGTGLPARGNEGLLSARLIGSSTRNLEEESRAGRFREELYFRLNGVCLRLPPLRHRREDIAELFAFFLQRHAAAFGREKHSVSASTLQLVEEHAWPGNIRELENFARKVVVLGDEQLAAADLTTDTKGNGHAPDSHNGRGISLKEAARAASQQAERELILRTLTRTRWNRKRAAQELSISYKALLYKLKNLDVDGSSGPEKQ